MRIAVLSDIHANHYALQAVLEDALQQGVEGFWFLGDLVGYGPAPVEVIKWLMGEWEISRGPDVWCIGNHDAMLADLVLRGQSGATPDLLSDSINYSVPSGLPNDEDPPEKLLSFSLHRMGMDGKREESIIYKGEARGSFLSALDWADLGSAVPLLALEIHRRELSRDARIDAFWRKAFTRDKVGPLRIALDDLEFVLVHASLRVPLFRYIYPWEKDILLPQEFAALNASFDTDGKFIIQFCGHTHVPMLVRGKFDGEHLSISPEFIFPDVPYRLDEERMMIVNPGSVGQPRDMDRRAAYVVLDSKQRTLVFRRVVYDWQEIAFLLGEKGYPHPLRLRLMKADLPSTTPSMWRQHYEAVTKDLA